MRKTRSDKGKAHKWSWKRQIGKEATKFKSIIREVIKEELPNLKEVLSKKFQGKQLQQELKKVKNDMLKSMMEGNQSFFNIISDLKQLKDVDRNQLRYLQSLIEVIKGKSGTISQQTNFGILLMERLKDYAGGYDKIVDKFGYISLKDWIKFYHWLVEEKGLKKGQFFYLYLNEENVDLRDILVDFQEFKDRNSLQDRAINAIDEIDYEELLEGFRW